MAAATSLVFNIIGNNNASAALNDVGGSVDSLGDKVKKWGGLAAAGVGVVAVAAAGFAVSAVNAASDLNETMSKSAAIFGANADDISAWGDKAAKTMGLSKAAAMEAAAGFGDMFTQIGFGGDQAASMSKDVVQMSADLGSFNNLGTDDVADRLSAAFRGEYDSLQALIPNINAARVEQEAMAATGKTNASELTAQEKAAAVLAIVHKDGAKAAGDFEKTSGGLANQQKILSASFEDVKAKVGTALLPILTKVGTFVIDKMLPAFGHLTPVIDKIKTAFSAMSSGFQEGDVTSTGFFGTFEKVGVVIKDVAGWVMGTAVPALRELWSWIQQHIIPAAQNLATQIMGGLSSAFNTIKAKIEENKPQLMELWGWFVTLAGYITDYVVPVFADYLKTGFQIAGIAIGFIIDFIGKIVDAVNWLVPVIKDAVDKIVAGWQWVSDAAGATKDWIVNAFNTVVDFVTGLPGRVASAASGMWDSVTNAATTAKDWISQKVEDIVGFFTGLPGRILGVGDSLLNAGKDIMGKLFDGLKSIASGAGGLAADIGTAIKNGINSLLRLPIRIPEIDTHIPGVGTVGGQTLLPAFARGGMLQEGYNIVGESPNGFEIAEKHGSSVQIHSNSKSKAMLSSGAGGGSGGGGDIYVTIYADVIAGPDAEAWMVSTIRKAVQNRGGSVSVLAG